MKKPITILVVDDNPILLDTIKRAARTNFPEAHFRQVLTTAQAIAYMNRFVDEPPGLVIISIESGDSISGFHCLAFLRARPIPFTAPVFMLSANQSIDDVLDAYYFGAASCLAKPHNATEWGAYLA